MKKNIFLPLFMLFVTFVNAQEIVNFTTEEGYTKSALYANENWDGSYAYPTWILDKANGTVKTATKFQKEVWIKPFKINELGDALRFRVDFSFNGTVNNVNSTLMSVGFNSAPKHNEGENNVVMVNSRTEGSLQIRDKSNAEILSPNVFVNLENSQGDQLAIEVTFTLGEKANSSKISAKLINITDGTESKLGSYTGVEKALFKAASKKGIYGMFNSLNFLKDQNISEIVISKVSMTSLTAE